MDLNLKGTVTLTASDIEAAITAYVKANTGFDVIGWRANLADVVDTDYYDRGPSAKYLRDITADIQITENKVKGPTGSDRH